MDLNEPEQEGGLLGSQAVARDYERKAVPVIAMSQVRFLNPTYPAIAHLPPSMCYSSI